MSRITNNRTDGVIVVFRNGMRIRIPPINFDQGSDASIESRSVPESGVYFRRVQDALGINRIQVKITPNDDHPGWEDESTWYTGIVRIVARKLLATFRNLNPFKKD